MSTHPRNTIFVDGANVAKEFEIGKPFSVIGLLRCAVFFRQKEFQTKVILHRNYRTLASTGRLEDGDQLVKLDGAGIVVFTPIGTEEKEFLIQLALDHGGIIVSNDKFETEKNKRQDWGHFLNRRVIPFRFINHEFALLPPTVDGHVMAVEEFLLSAYDLGGDVSSAAALTNYLLSMKVDETSDSSGMNHDRDGTQRPRGSSSSSHPTAPQRRYTVGQIIGVTTESASVEFQVSKDGLAKTTTFTREAYHPNGRLVRDLCREFHVGDWIGFISIKDGDRRWKVDEVRKKAEMRRGYGRFRPLPNNSTSGLIEARYRAESGGGDVFFPGAAFRDESTLLRNLKRGRWLYYYAFDQKASAGCTAVAVEVFPATTAGVIVKKTPTHVYVWSAKIGVGRGEATRFPEGTWVKFSFQQRMEHGQVYWIIDNLEMIAVPAGVKIETEQLEGSEESLVHIRCPAVTGIVTESHGTIWTEAFGRMTLSSTCLKQLFVSEPNGVQPYQPVRIWALYNGDHNSEEGDGNEAAASSTPLPKSKATEGDWRVISLIVCSGSAASGADPPFPPPSIIFGVEATLLHSEDDKNSDRGQHWVFQSEKYGKIFATPLDVKGSHKLLNIGDRVKATIVPQPLGYGDEYRALVVEKIQGIMLA